MHIAKICMHRSPNESFRFFRETEQILIYRTKQCQSQVIRITVALFLDFLNNLSPIISIIIVN